MLRDFAADRGKIRKKGTTARAKLRVFPSDEDSAAGIQRFHRLD